MHPQGNVHKDMLGSRCSSDEESSPSLNCAKISSVKDIETMIIVFELSKYSPLKTLLKSALNTKTIPNQFDRFSKAIDNIRKEPL